MVDPGPRKGSGSMNIDLDIEPTRPAPDPAREPERKHDRDPERTGHRREYDAREPRRGMSERVESMVRDVAAFRAIAQADLIKEQFGGHSYVALKGIAAAERAGWIQRHTAEGPNGGNFTVIVATPAGAARAAELWANVGRPHQQVLSGAVKPTELRHDCAVYRAATAAAAQIEAEGGRVVQVRVDAELKGRVASATERARQAEGRAAAEATRRRVAAELDLPMADGKVLFPDAQIEFENGMGRSGRCNVEVASEHYNGPAVRAKAAAGFQMYATAGRAAEFVRRSLAGGVGGGGRGGSSRGRGSREIEVFEI